MSKSKAFSAPKVWQDYKQSLKDEGAMDIPRSIKIKAVKYNTSSSSSSNTSKKDADDDTHICTKIIHFQRHGQGYHNLLGDVTRAFGKDFHIDDPEPEINPFVKPEICDSPLTWNGRQEAAAQSDLAATLHPQVIIVSPLHRAIQTAMISFQHHLDNNVEFIAHEKCREQLGLLTCNKALPLSQTMKEFPNVDFSLCTYGEEDSMWHKRPEVREHPVEEANRAYEFLTEFVMKRSEEEMAVVCHSAFLFSVFNCVVDVGGDESIESWFGTGEIRSLEVSFHHCD